LWHPSQHSTQRPVPPGEPAGQWLEDQQPVPLGLISCPALEQSPQVQVALQVRSPQSLGQASVVPGLQGWFSQLPQPVQLVLQVWDPWLQLPHGRVAPGEQTQRSAPEASTLLSGAPRSSATASGAPLSGSDLQEGAVPSTQR
jgi:hypothetical protein